MEYWIWLSNALGPGSPRVNDVVAHYETARHFYEEKKTEFRSVSFLSAAERKRLCEAKLSDALRIREKTLAKGYRILARRFRTPYGEIDLVARKRNLVAFVEVKARASLDEAAYAVTPRQQQRIVNAAQAWLMAHPEHAEFDLRFDAVLIAPKSLPRHLLAAFDASP